MEEKEVERQIFIHLEREVEEKADENIEEWKKLIGELNKLTRNLIIMGVINLSCAIVAVIIAVISLLST